MVANINMLSQRRTAGVTPVRHASRGGHRRLPLAVPRGGRGSRAPEAGDEVRS